MITDIIQETLQALRRNRTRALLTGLAVAWGIFMLVVLLGLARGVVNAFEASIKGRDFETLTVRGGVTGKPYRGYAPGRRITLRDTDPEVITQSGGTHIGGTRTTLAATAATISTPLARTGGGLTGVDPGQEQTEGLSLRSGRWINHPDSRERRRVMILPARKARILFGDPDKAVGRTVSSLGVSWLVAGVYDHRWRQTVYVPYSTLRSLLGDTHRVDNITVTGRDLTTRADAEAFESEVVGTLAPVHKVDPSDARAGAFRVSNSFEDYLIAQDGMKILYNAMWIIGLLTLLTGIVGVSNIMFVAVRERTHEIGIRRAIGARPLSVLTSVVAESVAVTLLSGYTGVVSGMIMVEIVDRIVNKPDYLLNPGISPLMAAEVTLALVAAGVLAGLFPAIKATHIRPVEALRNE